MELSKIPQTVSTPLVEFDPAKELLSIKGQSFPEDSFKFYEPVLSWMKEYLTAGSKLQVEFSLTYVNTSSSKCIMLILDILQEAHEAQHTVQLKWVCNADNEFEQECAEEFKEDYTFPFEIVLI